METVRVLSHLSPPPSTSREEEPPQEALRNSLPGAQLSALRAPRYPADLNRRAVRPARTRFSNLSTSGGSKATPVAKHGSAGKPIERGRGW